MTLTPEAPRTPQAPSPQGGWRRGHPLLWFAAIAALLPVAVPFGALLIRAAGGGASAAAVLFSMRTVELIRNTTLLVATVVAAAVAIGVGAAWLTERTDLPGRCVWRVVVALPLVLPSYVVALTVISALGPRGLLADLVGLGLPSGRGFLAAMWSLTVATYPFVYLIAAAAIRRIDPTLEEAARGLGSSPRRVFMTVVVPQLRQAIGVGGLLTALYTLSDFGAVSLAGYDTFTRVIYAQYAGRLDRTPAMVLAAALVLIALTILFAERRIRAGRSWVARPVSRPPHPTPLTRGQRRFATTSLVTLALVSLGLPIGTLVAWVARRPFPEGIPWGSLAGSVSASALAAVVATGLAIPAAVLVVRHRSRATATFERATYLAYSIPHITVGLGVVVVASRYLGPLYQSLIVLVAVYAAVFFAQALGAVSSAIAQVSPTLEDAARGLGRSRFGAIRAVTLPLVLPGVAAGALLVFLTTMKELPITLLARPIGFDTLAVDIWSAAGELLYPVAAVPAILLLAASAVPTYLLASRNR